MATTKAAVARRSAHVKDDCPVLDATVAAQLRTCVKESSAFSMGILGFLRKETPERQAAWLARSVDTARVLFQPWNMELLFVLAVADRARFTDLQAHLGISSRTLSDKLQALREAGYIEREVFDEQPVRIEYTPTKAGRKVAALASPLLAQLNVDAA